MYEESAAPRSRADRPRRLPSERPSIEPDATVDADVLRRELEKIAQRRPDAIAPPPTPET